MPNLPDRIANKISINSVTGCWEWTACTTATGYGRVWNGERSDWAHRVVYKVFRGSIPEDKVLDHLCRTRHCVNPEHLEPVTDRENTIRGDCPDVTRARHRAKRFCKRDHPLFGENVYLSPNGRRNCRKCHVIHKAAYEARKAAKLLELAAGGEGRG